MCQVPILYNNPKKTFSLPIDSSVQCSYFTMKPLNAPMGWRTPALGVPDGAGAVVVPLGVIPSHRASERASIQPTPARPPHLPICPVSPSVRPESVTLAQLLRLSPSVRPPVRNESNAAAVADFGGERRSLAPFDDAARPRRRCSLALSVSPVRPPARASARWGRKGREGGGKE